MSRPAHAILLALAILAGCKPGGPAPATKAGPSVRATVISIRSTHQPENRVFTRTIVIAGNKARSTSERDLWRLFDLQAKTVTFVDEIARTSRTEPLQKLLDARRAELAKPLPAHYPRVRVLRPGTRRVVLGANAEQFAIENGAYKRELWIGEHPSIPRDLFAMMHAAEPPTLPLAPMMRAVDEVLMAQHGFPLIDRAEVPVGKEKVVVENAVISVSSRDVPASLFELPRGR